MKTVGRSFGRISGPQDARGALRALQAEGVWELGDPNRGEPIKTHRSSWVRRWETELGPVFVKTYDYPRVRDRMRGWFRNTAFSPSRARREEEALAFLREHGLEAPEPLHRAELRGPSGLRRAVLVTGAWPGEPLDRLLPTLPGDQRETLLQCTTDYVQRAHALGYRDRNLDLRNLLAHREKPGESWTVAKLDAPRWRRVRPAEQRLRRADWRRLADSIRALGLPVPEAIRSRTGSD